MKTAITTLLFSFIIILLTGCGRTGEYQVYAIKFCDGWMIGAESVVIGSAPEDSVDVCNMFWLLRGSDSKVILVDAGFIDSSGSRKNYVRPDSMLMRLGITPQDVTDIIITHPHFDHINGISLFPDAKVWMQKNDYEYYTVTAWQEGGDNRGFDKKDAEKLRLLESQGRLTLLDGDNVSIYPGIKAFTGSKQTFENQYLLVNSGSSKNKILLASDAIWFYLNMEKHLSVSICMDTAAYVKAIIRMDSLVTDRDLIIPGHDDRLFSKFPEVKEWIVRIDE